MKYSVLNIICYATFIILLNACRADYSPKPRGYPRVVLPTGNYELYKASDCPFSFKHPNYTKIVKDTLFFRGKPENDCWFDISYPDLNARIHMSYKAMGNEKNELIKLISDAYKLNSKHMRVADYIDDSTFITKNGVYGIHYKVGGDAASSTQFLVTDSINHFIWASLYFKHAPNEDSIAPYVHFIRQDIDTLINSFQWQ